MGRKSFVSGFDSLLGESPIKENPSSAVKELEVRATFQMVPQQYSDLKAIAYWERKKIKEILKEALSSYIEKYVKEKGEILPIK